jgi:CheY-like chemotaxis protein
MTDMAHILIVDDNDQSRLLLRKVLQLDGYEVSEAANGEQGIQAFNQKPADLLITDILMPVMPGSKLISILRRRCPDLKIFAISGGGKAYQPESYLDYARELGANRILKKPISRNELLKAVHDILE